MLECLAPAETRALTGLKWYDAKTS